MNDQSTDKLVEAWHRFFANIKDHEKRAPDRWAADQVRRLLHDSFLVKEANEGVIDNPEKAWEMILLLIQAAPSRQGLAAVASPARQLLDKYFSEFISRVKDEVVHNKRLSYVLSQTFIHNDEHRKQVEALGHRAAIMHFPDDDDEKQLQEMDRLVADWFRWHREDDHESFYWAIKEVCQELPHRDPHRSWLVIQRLLAQSQSEDELEEVGEAIGELLSYSYADFIPAIRQAVPNDKRLAYALSSAYYDDEQKEEWSEFISLVDQYATQDPFTP